MWQSLGFGSMAILIASRAICNDIGSPESIAAACGARAEAVGRVLVTGTILRGQVDDATETRLETLWMGPIDARDETARLLAEVLEALPERECLSLKLWVAPEQIISRKLRRLDLDTAGHALESRRRINQIARPPAEGEEIHLDVRGTTVIQDGHVVFHLPDRAREPHLLPLDMTLIDWRPMTDASLLVPGQRLLFEWSEHDPAAVGLRLRGASVAGAGEASTLYRFSTLPDGAVTIQPRSIRSGFDSGDLVKVDYLLSRAEPTGLPVAVLDRRRSAVGDLWTVEVALLEEVAPVEAAALPEPRLPALRMELSPWEDSSELVATLIQPRWLEGASPEERLALGIATILNNWGSEDEAYDLNGDGIVDKQDLLKASQELR